MAREAQPGIKRRRQRRSSEELIAYKEKLRKERRDPTPEQEILIVGDKPPRAAREKSDTWVAILEPITKKPYRGQWCRVQEFESPTRASSAQKNCHQRKVMIPYPNHDWSFAARGCEFYAIYRGPGRPGKK